VLLVVLGVGDGIITLAFLVGGRILLLPLGSSSSIVGSLILLPRVSTLLIGENALLLVILLLLLFDGLLPFSINY